MSDTVTLTTINQTKTRLAVSVQYSSDGTGVTDTVVVDKSTFTGPDGTEPSRFVVEAIEYQTDGVQLTLEFEHATDLVIAHCVGTGYFDFTQGGKFSGFCDTTTTSTGDIVMTSVGHTSGDKASIILYLRLKD